MMQPPPPTSKWHYSNFGNVEGPISGSELKALASQGVITSETQIWKEGMANWTSATSIKGLLPSTPPPPNAHLAAPPPLHHSSPYRSPATAAVPTGKRPHRAQMIFAFGLGGLLFLAPFAIVAWVMGQSDLTSMDQGLMEDDGRSLTKTGMILGIVGVCCWALIILAVLGS